jgi:sugar phosphate isomerase/epimerase
MHLPSPTTLLKLVFLLLFLALPNLRAETPAPAAAPLPAALVAPENLLAWCIVPYDSPPRSPAARLAMLRRLGLTQYIWDWRPEHLASLPEELALAREAGIRVRGVWLWIDAQNDAPGRLGPSNRAVLDAVFSAGLRCEFWVGFNANVFASAPDDDARVSAGVAHLAPLLAELREHGGVLGLYNHGDWFGEPPNQLRILAALGDPTDAGLVYNFHHAHDQLARFGSFLPAMVPRLLAVNVSGVHPGGPKILPIGEGTVEAALLDALVRAGYRGPFGVLGHVENTDVETVLARNLAGLRQLADPAKP